MQAPAAVTCKPTLLDSDNDSLIGWLVGWLVSQLVDGCVGGLAD